MERNIGRDGRAEQMRPTEERRRPRRLFVFERVHSESRQDAFIIAGNILDSRRKFCRGSRWPGTVRPGIFHGQRRGARVY